MENFINLLKVLYPTSLFVLLGLLALWFILDKKEKKTKFLKFLIFIFIVLYFLSFFSNYDLEWFMIAWFLRDLLIFIIVIKLFEFVLKFKILLAGFLIIVASVIGLLYYKYGNISNILHHSKPIEFDDSAELIINVKDNNQIDQLRNLLSVYNVEILQAFPFIEDPSKTDLDECYTIDYSDTTNSQKIISTLNNSGLIDWIETNDTYTLSPIEIKSIEQNNINSYTSSTLNDPYITKLWGFNYMEIDNLNNVLEKKRPKKKSKDLHFRYRG